MNCCRCSHPADAWMIFDYSSGRIELYELAPDDDGFGGYAMCERHAGALTAPVGWTLEDTRPTTMTLFPLGSVTRTAATDVTPVLKPVPDSDVA